LLSQSTSRAVEPKHSELWYSGMAETDREGCGASSAQLPN